MENDDIAACLAELGHPIRLRSYRYLVKMGRAGVAVGDIQRELGIPASTLSHHLSRLTRVGLVVQQRDGRTLYCQPQYERLQQIISFLTDECCAGEETCVDVQTCCP